MGHSFIVLPHIIDVYKRQGLDSTPIAANTSQNNPKSFLSNKFKPDNQPKADTDCKLDVHTASNHTNEKKYEFDWGYKNHVLVDCISGLPIYELTTTANVHDSTVALLSLIHIFHYRSSVLLHVYTSTLYIDIIRKL